MSKLDLNDIGSGFNLATVVNANNAAIEAEFDNTISRDGSAPNTMLAPLDMNSKEILNVGSPTGPESAARLADVQAGTSVTNVIAPSQTGNANRALYTDGSGTLSWRDTPYKAQTSAETTASLTVTDFSKDEGDIRRYPSGSTAQLAAAADVGGYRESSTTYSVATGGLPRLRVIGSSTETQLELWSADAADTGDVYIRFCENNGQTKGFVGFTASVDDTMSMTSYEDVRMKFRTGDGTGNNFINRAHIYGNGVVDSWLAVESPRSDDIGGCYIRFVEDDPTNTKGYIGYSSTTTNDIYIINTETNRHIEFQTNGTGIVKSIPPLGLTDGVSAPAAISGFALLYVDSADGDLKVRFGDGVTKTIVVDT